MAIYTTYSQFRAGFSSGAIGLDGFKLWPGSSVAAPGTLTMGATIAAFPFTISVGGTNDAVAGVDEYDWYLSQRSDVTTKQYLSVSRNDPLPNTMSARISVNITALATGLQYGTIPLSIKDILALFTDVEVYVLTKATGAIRHMALLDKLTSDGP